MNARLRTLLALAVLGAACGERAPEPEAVSVLGDPLFAEGADAPGHAERLAALAEAEAAWRANPEDEEAAIWYGRRLGYLQRYREAIEVYSEALALHPDSPRLLRHRGHRYLSVRRFVDAIRDLSRAAELAERIEDEVEPDGIPNARDEPRSTLKFNIWYHLALAYWCNGERPQAWSAFGECYGIAGRNDDLLVAATHWYYLASRHIGLHADAEALLERITLDMDVVENQDYLALLMFYKGHFTAEEVLDVEDPLGLATRGYGVARQWLLEERTSEAADLLLRVVDEGPWPSFGVIAAEVELSLM